LFLALIRVPDVKFLIIDLLFGVIPWRIISAVTSFLFTFLGFVLHRSDLEKFSNQLRVDYPIGVILLVLGHLTGRER
jgi:hypothetical protein